MNSTFDEHSDNDISEHFHCKITHCIHCTFYGLPFFHFQTHHVKVDDGLCDSEKSIFIYYC